MKLNEAIEIKRRELAKYLGGCSLASAITLGDKKAHADQLGIEALEREQLFRQRLVEMKCAQDIQLLPSETEE